MDNLDIFYKPKQLNRAKRLIVQLKEENKKLKGKLDYQKQLNADLYGRNIELGKHNFHLRLKVKKENFDV